MEQQPKSREYVISQLTDKLMGIRKKAHFSNNTDLDLLRKVSFIIDELLSDSELERRFKESLSHLDDVEIKVKVFSVIRNILAHFPFYQTWEEIYLNREIVCWTGRLGGSIVSFFSDANCGRSFSYDVYFHLEYSPKKIKQTITVKIPSLTSGFYLRDFIDLQDLYHTFFLIDHLLEDLGIETQHYNPPSA